MNHSPWKPHQPAAAVRAALYPSHRWLKSHTSLNNPFLQSSRKLSCQQEASPSGFFFLEKSMHAVSCLSTYSKKFKQIIANKPRGVRRSTEANRGALGGPTLCQHTHRHWDTEGRFLLTTLLPTRSYLTSFNLSYHKWIATQIPN